jgi:hypothetical protein
VGPAHGRPPAGPAAARLLTQALLARLWTQGQPRPVTTTAAFSLFAGAEIDFACRLSAPIRNDVIKRARLIIGQALRRHVSDVTTRCLTVILSVTWQMIEAKVTVTHAAITRHPNQEVTVRTS